MLAERCVPLARNVMRTSCVMFASQVMCAAAREERNTSLHLAPRRNTSLWRSHNSTAATPRHHFLPHRQNRGQIRTATHRPLLKARLIRKRCNFSLNRFEPPHRLETASNGKYEMALFFQRTDPNHRKPNNDLLKTKKSLLHT